MNGFGKEFLTLIKKKPLISFPEEKEIKFNKDGKKFSISTIRLQYKDFDEELIANCLKLSDKKINKTMDQNQAGKKRPKDIKKINQFRGVLAETIVHLYLYYKCNFDIKNILRYDLERETFDYKPEEYDLKLLLNKEKEISLEVRSSNNPFETIGEYLEKRGIICSYRNTYKPTEKKRDLYLAVIYDRKGHIGSLKENERREFISDLENNKYEIYLVLHCATKEKVSSDGVKKTYGQNGTEYIEVPFFAIACQTYHIKNVLNIYQK